MPNGPGLGDVDVKEVVDVLDVVVEDTAVGLRETDIQYATLARPLPTGAPSACSNMM
jgi:hypothetical protein